MASLSIRVQFRGILKKGHVLNLMSRILSSWAPEDVIAHLQFAILHSIYMRPVGTHAFVELLSRFSNVSRITSATEHNVDDIFA